MLPVTKRRSSRFSTTLNLKRYKMTALNTRFTPRYNLTPLTNMTMGRTYTVTKVSSSRAYFTDDVGEIRNIKLSDFDSRFSLRCPKGGTPEYSVGDLLILNQTVDSPPYRNITVGQTYRINYILANYIGFKDDTGAQCSDNDIEVSKNFTQRTIIPSPRFIA